MRLSEARILYLARESLTRLRDEKLADISNFQAALRTAREVIEQFAHQGDAIDETVRRKIASLRRNVLEGTPEWNILYRRYREEEMRKRGPAR
jgi:hypothetical protein